MLFRFGGYRGSWLSNNLLLLLLLIVVVFAGAGQVARPGLVFKSKLVELTASSSFTCVELLLDGGWLLLVVGHGRDTNNRIADELCTVQVI